MNTYALKNGEPDFEKAPVNPFRKGGSMGIQKGLKESDDSVRDKQMA